VSAPVYVCDCGHPKTQHIRERGACRAGGCDCLDFDADLKASAALQGVELAGAEREHHHVHGLACPVTGCRWLGLEYASGGIVRQSGHLPPLMPGGESAADRLRHAEQEMDVVRGSLTEMAALYDSATAETARVAQERDELRGRATRLGDIALQRRQERNEAWRERDLARAELTSARTELEHLREHQEIRARVVREKSAEVARLRGQLADVRAATTEQVRAARDAATRTTPTSKE